MGAKKKTSSPEEDETTKMALEQFWKVYKINCKNLEIPISKLIKEKYDEAQENDTVIVKVSYHHFTLILTSLLIVSYLGATWMARCKSNNGLFKNSQVL